MPRVLDPFRFALITLAGWMNQRQLHVIDYLGAAAYGGVFTKEQLNFTHSIYSHAGAKPQVDTAFEQKMSAYSCATMLMFDQDSKNMYTTRAFQWAIVPARDTGDTRSCQGNVPTA